MAIENASLLTEAEYMSRFNEAVAFYDHYILMHPEESMRTELAERAAQTAKLPVMDADLYNIIVLYHSSPAPYSTSLLRYVYLAYRTQHL